MVNGYIPISQEHRPGIQTHVLFMMRERLHIVYQQHGGSGGLFANAELSCYSDSVILLTGVGSHVTSVQSHAGRVETVRKGSNRHDK